MEVQGSFCSGRRLPKATAFLKGGDELVGVVAVSLALFSVQHFTRFLAAFRFPCCNVFRAYPLGLSLLTAALGRWRRQTRSLQHFIRTRLFLLQNTDQLVGVGVAVPDGTVELMVPPLHPVELIVPPLHPVELIVPPIHPVVRSGRLAKHIPHGDREIAVDLTTHSRCCR